ETDWADILTPRGWTLHHVDRRTGERHWTRPGKDPREGSSATTGFTDRDTLKVFTSSVPELEPEGVYTKLGFLAAMDHGGDHAAAARALAAAGWGAPPVDLDIVDPLVARAAPEATEGEGEAPGVGGWEFVDLGPILDGSYAPPVPTIGRRSDGAALIYAGRVHSIAGEPGGGKTWLALHILAETIREGGIGALIDYEDTPMAAVNRLRLLGLGDDEIRAGFRYVRPDGPLVTRGGKVAGGTVAALEALGADVVVIDSVGESLAVEGLPPNDDDAVAQWFRRLPRMLARSGAAVIGLDHVTKSKDDRGLWAIGSQRKLAAIDGAAYGVEVGVAPTKTKDGKLKVTCAKDRHGTYQRGHLVAHVEINNTSGGGVEVLIQAPEERVRPTFYMEQVSRFLEDIPCASVTGVQRGVQGKTDTIRLALECLVEEGYVAKEATKSGHQYRSVRAFREDDPVENLTAPPAPPRAPDDRGAAPRPTAPHRAPMDRGAVSGDLESDRAPRAPDPPRSGGPAGARSEATAADGRELNERDRAPAHESDDDIEEWF